MDQAKVDTAISEKIRKAGLSEELTKDFLAKVDRVRKGETGKVDWSTIGDLDPKEDEIDLEEIRKKFPASKDSLSKLVVIKLNGGLGTSMGLSKAKSLLAVKEERSFLNIITNQILYYRKKFGVEIPLILMDSYNTQKDSNDEIIKSGLSQKIPTSFLQNKVPRLDKETFLPVTLSDEKEEWCPPGHGDIYLSLKETGILKQLLDKGYEYAFLSNGDNLGATIEPHILSYLMYEKLEFVMEMTPKTLADLKGGAIYRKIVNGKFEGLELLETAQVPKEHEHEFSGMGKFRTFSTNNLWINLKALYSILEKGSIRLSLIVNPKKVEGKEVLQLETAMGSAIGNFKKTKGIIIPRERFAPVKKCEDFLIRMSDAYILNEDYSLTMSPERKKSGMGENIVSLDDNYYKKFNDFLSLFPITPSLLYSESLKVEGKVEFDVPVTFKGKVTIKNKSHELKRISSISKKEFKDEEIEL